MQYYILDDSLDRRVVDESMILSRATIQKNYGRYVRAVMNDKTNKNVLYIFDTIFDRAEENIVFDGDANDVILGHFDTVLALNKMGYNLYQSVDVSLRTYLSLLYLRNDSCQLVFNNRKMTMSIAPQCNLQKIDKLSKMGAIVDLQ